METQPQRTFQINFKKNFRNLKKEDILDLTFGIARPEEEGSGGLPMFLNCFSKMNRQRTGHKIKFSYNMNIFIKNCFKNF